MSEEDSDSTQSGPKSRQQLPVKCTSFVIFNKYILYVYVEPLARISIPGRGDRFFAFLKWPVRIGNQPAIYPIACGYSLAYKRLGQETDNTPSSSDEVNKELNWTPLPHKPLWCAKLHFFFTIALQLTTVHPRTFAT